MKSLKYSIWQGLSLLAFFPLLSFAQPPGQANQPAAVTSGQAQSPFVRYIIIHNELAPTKTRTGSKPNYIWPVVQVPQDGNCKPGSQNLDRILVPGGVAPGQTVKIYMPNQCWYRAGRVYIFTTDIGKFEDIVFKNQQTSEQTPNSQICKSLGSDKTEKGSIPCVVGTAGSSYPLDAPAQLAEYTFDAENMVGNDPDSGIPMTDIDVSYVDQVYIPLAMAVDNGGTAGYMGSILNLDEFNHRVSNFIPAANWQPYAAYALANWPTNKFKNFVNFQSFHVPAAYNLFTLSTHRSTSDLFTLPATQGTGTSGLSSWRISTSGSTTTAPATKPYMVYNTDDNGNNPSVQALIDRWVMWRTTNPCENPPQGPAGVNQQAFCDQFKATLDYVWNQFLEFSKVEKSAAYCSPLLSRNDHNRCIVGNIIGYTSDINSGQLPESVQALLRGVPYGTDTMYHQDKWLLFWAPYNSKYNLNPFSHFIHNTEDGIDAVAYSFSIDDKYGNFRDEGKGFIIDVGGSSLLDNKAPFDPYQQYKIGWAPGWDHATICGRDMQFDAKVIETGSNTRVSMWQNGKEQPYCDITFYSKPGNSPTDPHVSFRVSLENKSVKDNYTGQNHTVESLKSDQQYCQDNSVQMKQICTRTNFSSHDSGDEAYVNVDEKDRPIVSINLPSPATDDGTTGAAMLNFAQGWDSATGCATQSEKAGNVLKSTGLDKSVTPCVTTLTGTDDKGQTVTWILTVLLDKDGLVDMSQAQPVTCKTKDNAPCPGGAPGVDAKNVSLPPPVAGGGTPTPPPVTTGANLNFAQGWDSATGCATQSEKAGNVLKSTGLDKSVTPCVTTLTGTDDKGQTVTWMLTVLLDKDGLVDMSQAQPVTCKTKDNSTCPGTPVYDAKNINLPPPAAGGGTPVPPPATRKGNIYFPAGWTKIEGCASKTLATGGDAAGFGDATPCKSTVTGIGNNGETVTIEITVPFDTNGNIDTSKPVICDNLTTKSGCKGVVVNAPAQAINLAVPGGT